MSHQEERFHIADIYRSVELEAFDTYGTPVVLIRFVFPDGIQHIHLQRDNPVPHSVYTLSELVKKIESFDPGLPVHFIADDPVFCGVIRVVQKLNRRTFLNTSGFLTFPPDLFSRIYINSRPGVMPLQPLLDASKEVRAYWNPGDLTFEEHVEILDKIVLDRSKLFLVPYNIDQDTIEATIRACFNYGWRFGLHMASAIPNLDKAFASNPEAEEVYHQRYHETISRKKSK